MPSHQWGLAAKKRIPRKEDSFFVSAERLELSTNGLKGHCSAIELRARNCEGGFYHHPSSASIIFLILVKLAS